MEINVEYEDQVCPTNNERASFTFLLVGATESYAGDALVLHQRLSALIASRKPALV